MWTNRYILVNRKSVYIDEWYSKGFWAVAHFMDDKGNVLQYMKFCEKFQSPAYSKELEQIDKSHTSLPEIYD